jgi:hypothetical protein
MGIEVEGMTPLQRCGSRDGKSKMSPHPDTKVLRKVECPLALLGGCEKTLL